MDSHDRKAGASELEPPITQCRRLARDNHPFLLIPATPGERLFVRMSLAPAAVPNPVIMSIVSFGGGTTIRYPSICQLFLASHIGAAGVGHRKTRTLEPLTKSQSQCGAEPNIDKKAPTIFEVRFAFSSAMEGVCSAQVQGTFRGICICPDRRGHGVDL